MQPKTTDMSRVSSILVYAKIWYILLGLYISPWGVAKIFAFAILGEKHEKKKEEKGIG